MDVVLVVSNEGRIGRHVRSVLGSQGWFVTTAADREEALRASADHQPGLVVVDCEVDGAYELVRTFGSKNGGPGVLLLEPDEGVEDTFGAFESGADQILSKPPRAQALLEAAERVMSLPHHSAGSVTPMLGEKLGSEEIFGDLLLELEGDSEDSAVDPSAGAAPAQELAAEPKPETEPEPTSTLHAREILAIEEQAQAAHKEQSPLVTDELDEPEEFAVSAEADAESDVDDVPPAKTVEDLAGGEPEEPALEGWSPDSIIERLPEPEPELETEREPELEPTAADETLESETAFVELEPVVEVPIDNLESAVIVAPSMPEKIEEAAAECEPSEDEDRTEVSERIEQPQAYAADEVETLEVEDETASEVTPVELLEAEAVAGLESELRTADEATQGDVGSGTTEAKKIESSAGELDLIEFAELELEPAGSAEESADAAKVDSADADAEITAAPPAARVGPPTDAESTRFGQYKLDERIAVGGMAEVWRASMLGVEGFRKTVAIKKILPHLAENSEFVAMFIEEAKLAAQLSHENLVEIYDLGKIGPSFFIAMEYVDGRDLRSLLNRLRQRSEQMPIGLALLIGAQVARGLEYAHTRQNSEGEAMGLVHRDVSPRNVLIGRDGRVRLCDFGVAKAVSSVIQTEIGALKGKLQYMSPEQASGKAVDGRSDIYSLGSVMYEIIANRRLYEADNELSLLDAVRAGNFDDPRKHCPGLPQEVRRILVKALAKKPSVRYQTAGELEHDLRALLRTLGAAPSEQMLSEFVTELFTAQVELPRVEEVAQATSATDTDLPSAETRSLMTTLPTPRSRVARFWWGVIAGLVAAGLAAAGIKLLLG